jgi:hypothetical protein
MSPLGFDRDLNVINADDTAEVYAYIYDTVSDEPIPEDDLATVQFTIHAPDESEEVKTGEILEDGTGYVRYTNTSQIGEYKVVAKFTLSGGIKRSVRADFEVIDPFNPPTPSDEQVIAKEVWFLLEDCFDSEEGGPWLSDVTMATFKKEKMERFISKALFDINQQNPPTNVGVPAFIAGGQQTADFPLLVQSTLVEVIRHLMRSYTEQPLPQGAQIVYEDRRDYLQRWREIYDMEFEHYMRFLALWKRKFLGLGESRILVGSKAGRLIPAPMRTRFVGRGYW